MGCHVLGKLQLVATKTEYDEKVAGKENGLFKTVELFECDRVRVIVFEVDADYAMAHYDELLGGLYKQRQAAVRKLKVDSPKAMSIAAGYALQYVIKEQLGLEAEDIIIETEQNGKPHIREHKDFIYNMSHSGGYVAVAYVVADNDGDAHGDAKHRNPVYSAVDQMLIKSIGIDIEAMRSYSISVAKRCFLGEEYDYILRADEDEQSKRFFEIWTMKECYLKMKGTGINVPMNSFLTNPIDKIIKDENNIYECIRHDTDKYILSMVME